MGEDDLITCPFCGTKNRNNRAICYNCEKELPCVADESVDTGEILPRNEEKTTAFCNRLKDTNTTLKSENIDKVYEYVINTKQAQKETETVDQSHPVRDTLLGTRRSSFNDGIQFPSICPATLELGRSVIIKYVTNVKTYKAGAFRHRKLETHSFQIRCNCSDEILDKYLSFRMDKPSQVKIMIRGSVYAREFEKLNHCYPVHVSYNLDEIKKYATKPSKRVIIDYILFGILAIIIVLSLILYY